MHHPVILVGPVLDRTLQSNTLKLLHLDHAPQIAVDGGIRFAPHAKLWVGDGDSSSPPESIPVLKKVSQSETDLRFCLNILRSQKQMPCSELHLFGFLGGQKDHELANLGELNLELKNNPELVKAVFYDQKFKQRIYIYPAGSHSLSRVGLFSLLVFEPAIITVSGQCRFPVSDLRLEAFAGQGISNEGHGPITIKSSSPFLYFLREI